MGHASGCKPDTCVENPTNKHPTDKKLALCLTLEVLRLMNEFRQEKPPSL